jgi:transposase
MDTIETLKQDLKAGRISAERLVDLVADLCRKLEAANQRIEELEKQCGGTPTAKVDEPFSTRAEEQRQEARGKKRPRRKPKGRRGRVSTDDKVAQAERTESVFPEGVPPTACWLSHVRPVWRLEDGRAVLVAYQIYRGPGNRYGQIPGVLGRSEYGLEIVTEIAYLVYLVGLSFDKVCHLLNFFQDLRLRKSQANTLLYQLARDWEREFDALCTLLADSLVVHADETRWSLNSVWAFLSEKARVLLFGVPNPFSAHLALNISELPPACGISCRKPSVFPAASGSSVAAGSIPW